MSNISAYKELEEGIANQLEAHYQQLRFSGDIQGAYQVLGKLMAYKLIDKNDERLSSKYKPFKNAGIDTDSRFRLDIRRDSNYIPEWLFYDLPHYFGLTLQGREYAGKRVELVYESNVIYPPREFHIKFRLLNTPNKAKDGVDGFARIIERRIGKKIKTTKIKREIETGYSRIYDIVIDNNVQNKYRNLGYLMVYRNNDTSTIESRIVIRAEVFDYYYISVGGALNDLYRSVKKNLRFSNLVQVQSPIDYSEEIIKQKQKFRDNHNNIIEMRKAMTGGK